MTQLAAWVALCAVGAIVLRRRPVDAVLLALVLWFLLPAYAASRVTGIDEGPLALHPASWFVLAVVVVQLVRAPGTMARLPADHPFAVVAVGLFVTLSVATSVLSGSGGLSLVTDQVLGPFLAFWLVVVFGDHASIARSRNAVLVLVAVECLVALAQRQLGQLIPFASEAGTLYWFDPLTFTRWFGLTDSPLVLSLAVCAATPLLAGIDRHLVRLGLAGLFLLGCLVAQSRTGAALMILLLVWSLWRSRTSLGIRVAYLFVMGVAGAVVVQSSVAAGVGSRFTVDDGGSTGARLDAVSFFFSNLPDYLLVGNGPTSSYAIADAGGLITSLESSYLMWAVDCGAIAATLYFGVQGLLVLTHARGGRAPGVATAALVGCFLQHTYSGVATSSLVGTLTWVLIAMTVVAGHPELPSTDEAELAEELEVTGSRADTPRTSRPTHR